MGRRKADNEEGNRKMGNEKRRDKALPCLYVFHAVQHFNKRSVSTFQQAKRFNNSTSEAIQHPPNISPPSDQPPLAFQDEIE